MATNNAISNAVIRFTQINRRTGERRPSWLASASFADGPGMRVKKMTTTPDRDKAARFSVENAHAIAVQFSQYPADLEFPDGRPMVEASAALHAAQDARFAEVARMRAEINALFADAFRAVGLRPSDLRK